MLIVSYDISNNKLRSQFSKFLCKFGNRLQYSVFILQNSERILENVRTEIESKFKKRFSQDDSVYIFSLSKLCSIKRYGYAENEEKDLLIL